MRSQIALLSVAWTALFFASSAAAQSLAAVPHPDVKAGERVLDYRAGYALADDGRSPRFGQRYHFMVALDDRIRLRVVVQHGERADGVVATQTISPQAQVQLVESESSGGWDSAIRLDGFIPIDGRPGRARLGYFNAIDFGRSIEARGDLFLARDFGDQGVPGVQIETRAELSFAAAAKTRAGVQLFNALNSTARFGSFDEQRHQLGVFARSKPAKRLGVEAGWLFGLSGAAPDADFRLIVTYSL